MYQTIPNPLDMAYSANHMPHLFSTEAYGSIQGSDSDYEFTNPHPPCETLKQWRIAAGLGQAQLSHWCYLASIAVAIESREPGSVTPLHSAHPMSLLEACIFTQWHSRLDSTHISKFEKGHQVPWRNAQKILAIVFSAIQKRPVSTEELFPELANGSSMTLEMIEEFERRRAADLMVVHAAG